jgi:hypothetical protein
MRSSDFDPHQGSQAAEFTCDCCGRIAYGRVAHGGAWWSAPFGWYALEDTDLHVCSTACARLLTPPEDGEPEGELVELVVAEPPPASALN